MVPVKYRGVYNPNRFIQNLLRQLGMPKSIWNHRNFWEYHYGRLDIILYDARQLYKKHARRVHPRRATDAEEEAKNLNMVWQEIQRRFDQHMNPRLIFAGGRRDPKARPYCPPGHYLRVCPYHNCQRVFITKHKHKMYCDPRHRAAFNHFKWYRKRRAQNRRVLRKCKNPRCNLLFWTKNLRKVFHSERCMVKYHLRLFRQRNAEAERIRTKKFRHEHPERTRAYYRRPEVRERKNRQQREWYQRDKLKRQAAKGKLVETLLK